MKKTLLVFLIFSGILSAQNYKKVKIFINDKEDIKTLHQAGLEFDHLFLNEEENSLEVFISDEEFTRLTLTNFKFEILINNWREYFNSRPQAQPQQLNHQLTKMKSLYNVSGFNFGSMAGFLTFTEVIAELDSMKMLYPDLITEKTSIGSTHEKRPLYMVKISDNPDSDEDEPEVLYTAMHHAREPESMMQLIYFMYYLLENYNSDPSVTYLINNRELFFIPVVNPDGYEYNRSTDPAGGGFWRKNRRDNGNGTFGVDLNRNYGPLNYWNAPNGGSSTFSSSEVYRGPAPFSEPETEAIKNFLAEHEIKTALNYHSYGNYLIFPYGALGTETPDSALFREFAADMTQYNKYKIGTDLQTVNYSTRGNSDDYFYDGDVSSNGKIFAMTPEVGRNADGFWPHQLRILPLAEENLFPNLYYAFAAGEFIKLSNANLTSGSFQPAETVSFNPEFKNKGLKNAESIKIELSSLTPYCIINKNSADISSLASGESILINDKFEFYITSDAPQGLEINLLFKVRINGEETSHDTVKFKVEGAALPVELVSFSAENYNGCVRLKWSTASELNNYGYEIYRNSFRNPDNNYWILIGFIEGNGTTNEQKNYSFIDENPIKGKSYYRLKQIDLDGNSTYSKMAEVNFALAEFELKQNYPNPFNPTTKIEFTIPDADSSSSSIVNGTNGIFVELKIYDVLGNEIAALIKEYKSPGNYKVEFNASSAAGGEGLPSGIYYYRLTAGNFTSTKKLMLLK